MSNEYKVGIEDVTLATFEGTGAFDIMMKAMKLHLHQEYAEGRITGDSYAQAYIAMSNQVLAQAVQFALQAKLMTKKVQSEAANTEDTVDGNTVAGTVGKQKEVYDAQIKGFRDDALQKATKMMTDIWTVQRSTDVGIQPTPDSKLYDKNIGSALSELFKSQSIPMMPAP